MTLKKVKCFNIGSEGRSKTKVGRERHRRFSKSSRFDPGHTILKITGFYDYKYQVTAFNECNNLI